MPRRYQKAQSSKISGYAFRLKPHEDLKQRILEFARVNDIKAGVVVSGVGSLEQYCIRYANQREGVLRKGCFEIVSLTGTLSGSSCHIHISVADKNGKTSGGHLLDGNLIYTTAEIALLDLHELTFQRKVDPTYNYKELLVVKKMKSRQ
jgi:uncharacterized protein